MAASPSLHASSALLAILLLSAAHTTRAGALEIKGDAAFDAAVAASPFLVAAFISPQCGHCARFAPVWDSAAADLERMKSSAVAARVDCTAPPNHALCQRRFDIKSYPTLLSFAHGVVTNPKPYSGPIRGPLIADYMNARASPAAPRLGSSDAVAAFVAHLDLPGVIAFVPDADHDSADAFTHVAERYLGQITFALVPKRSLLPPGAPKCASAADCDSPLAMMIKPGHGSHNTKQDAGSMWTYPGHFAPDILTRWVSSRAAPLVVHVTGSKLDDDARAARRVAVPHCVVVVSRESDVTPTVLSEVEAAAKAFFEMKFFVIAAKGPSASLLGSFGIAPTVAAPAFYIHAAANRSRFLKEGVRISNLPEFIEEFEVGALEPIVRSEEGDAATAVAAANDPAAIIPVTGRTYRQLVRDSEWVTLLSVHAVGSEPDADLEQTLAAVAATLAEEQAEEGREHGGEHDDDALPLVRVAMIDAAKNDVPDSRIHDNEIPGIFFIPKHASEHVVRFEDEEIPSEQGLMVFVERTLIASMEEELHHDEL